MNTDDNRTQADNAWLILLWTTTIATWRIIEICGYQSSKFVWEFYNHLCKTTQSSSQNLQQKDTLSRTRSIAYEILFEPSNHNSNVDLPLSGTIKMKRNDLQAKCSQIFRDTQKQLIDFSLARHQTGTIISRYAGVDENTAPSQKMVGNVSYPMEEVNSIENSLEEAAPVQNPLEEETLSDNPLEMEETTSIENPSEETTPVENLEEAILAKNLMEGTHEEVRRLDDRGQMATGIQALFRGWRQRKLIAVEMVRIQQQVRQIRNTPSEEANPAEDREETRLENRGQMATRIQALLAEINRYSDCMCKCENTCPFARISGFQGAGNFLIYILILITIFASARTTGRILTSRTAGRLSF